MLARYRDLSRLRYDYPLVLTAEGGAAPVASLADTVNAVLRRVAEPGPGGERVRRHVLRLEQRIRELCADGATGHLSALWRWAAEQLIAEEQAANRAPLAESLNRALRALDQDGPVLDCNAQTPAELATHLWRAAESARARRFADRIDRLILRLRALLRADFLESDQARAPENLRRAFSPAYENVLDFEAMSRMLRHAPRGAPLTARRRRRIRAALKVLEGQRFAPAPAVAGGVEPYDFTFDSCTEALRSLRSRLPEMAAVIKVIGIAELELENRYHSAVHDPFFEQFHFDQITPADLAWFPSYLVVLREGGLLSERSAVLDALAAGLPVKVLIQLDDILGNLPLTGGKLVFGRNRPQFAAMALGLHSAFVLQSASSHLYRMREAIGRGMVIDGPALFGVYSGCGDGTAPLPPYLTAAAAVESRAFPLFVYDPTAGDDWASRLDIRDNPQPEANWPVHPFEYEGPGHRRRTEQLAFTFADFAVCDRRHAAGLGPDAAESGRKRPDMAAFLRHPPDTDATACVPLVDGDNVLHRLAVGEDLVQATRRCADAWRSLQELGGFHNSHVRQALERQRSQQETAAQPGTPQEEEAPPAGQGAEEGHAQSETAAAEAEAATDAPYIETPRCTTCEECIRINDRMFGYDENKQAYIPDPALGTYRELVEAAEACQVAIIHPGKPRNPDEPGLDELLERAAPFQ